MPNNVIEFDPRVEPWLANVVKNMQTSEDITYNDKLRSWNQANKDWLVNAQQAYTIGLAFPIPPVVPTKEVFGVKDGQLTQYTYKDSSLVPPTFAPVVAGPKGELHTDAPAKDAQVDAMLKAILQTVLAIKVKLGA